jgi:hypothetical protein
VEAAQNLIGLMDCIEHLTRTDMLLFTQHLSGYYLVILQIMGRCNCFGD